MKKITNTTRQQRVEWLMGGNPNAIEAQEAQGQVELVESSQLPSKVNSPRGINREEQYALMGIKVLGKTNGDEYFFDVELPKGWKKKATDHSMWSDLLDDKNRVRATIFYKAAFYDRDAFINFNRCLSIDIDFSVEGYISYLVKNNSTGEILLQTDKLKKDYSIEGYFKLDEALRKECEDFLNNEFPEHENINAYWD